MDATDLILKKRVTRAVNCGQVTIGAGNPISVQTMTNTDTRDVDATSKQIQECVLEGADIVRVAVLDQDAAKAISAIKKKTSCPLVADIHFDYRLALLSLEHGADKVRVNPGNIGGPERLLEVAKSADRVGASIRIGINGGSLEKDILDSYGSPCPEALVESARRCLDFLAQHGFQNVVVSLKSSDVTNTLKAYALLAPKTDAPFHIGITEAGPGLGGIVKSSTGIGALLALGLGDTLRVSLTEPPVEEVKVGKHILQALGKRRFGPDIISCPTCGRTQVNLDSIVRQVANELSGLSVPIKIAIMGCPVNGPGEAKEADVGIACGRQGGILFSHGKILKTVKQDEMVKALLELVQHEVSCLADRGQKHG